MNKFYLILCLSLCSTLGLVACQSTADGSISTKETANPQTLIVYYEQGEKETALKVTKELGASVIYEYNNLNSIAIHTKYPKTALNKLGSTKGILSAEVSHIYELH